MRRTWGLVLLLLVMVARSVLAANQTQHGCGAQWNVQTGTFEPSGWRAKAVTYTLRTIGGVKATPSWRLSRMISWYDEVFRNLHARDLDLIVRAGANVLVLEADPVWMIEAGVMDTFLKLAASKGLCVMPQMRLDPSAYPAPVRDYPRHTNAFSAGAKKFFEAMTEHSEVVIAVALERDVLAYASGGPEFGDALEHQRQYFLYVQEMLRARHLVEKEMRQEGKNQTHFPVAVPIDLDAKAMWASTPLARWNAVRDFVDLFSRPNATGSLYTPFDFWLARTALPATEEALSMLVPKLSARGSGSGADSSIWDTPNQFKLGWFTQGSSDTYVRTPVMLEFGFSNRDTARGMQPLLHESPAPMLVWDALKRIHGSVGFLEERGVQLVGISYDEWLDRWDRSHEYGCTDGPITQSECGPESSYAPSVAFAPGPVEYKGLMAQFDVAFKHCLRPRCAYTAFRR
mmetsp:Transcript_10627/g.34922  ORF Transcript_10627/g.34922 Transcript_10627/m.34922 type:complete len:458 (-) Transcript_10627:45-1418(-)